MIDASLAHKIKELELQTRRMLCGSGIGATRSRQKGFGLEFDQLRSYQYGDDVRLIDWKSSARAPGGGLFVRQYFHEHNRTFMLCLDISGSTIFGSGSMTKQEIMQQITGIMAYVAGHGSDKVGLILFSNTVEHVIWPHRGRQHVQKIVEKIFTHKPQSAATDFMALSNYIRQYMPEKMNLIIVSDFMSSDLTVALKRMKFQKNIIAICYLDQREVSVANVGLVWMVDPETDKLVLVSTQGSSQKLMQQNYDRRLQEQLLAFGQQSIDVLMLKDSATIMHDMITFFKKLMVY